MCGYVLLCLCEGFLLCRFLSAEMIKCFSLSYINKLFGVAFCSYVFIYWEIVKVLSIFTEFPRIRVQEKQSLSLTWLAGVSGHLAPDTMHSALCSYVTGSLRIKLHRARREMFSDVRRRQKALVVWCVLVFYPKGFASIHWINSPIRILVYLSRLCL